MSMNTMTAHEPINYLDSILNEEEKRCEYSHQWRNFTISRSGRFKSKNKHRNVVDGKMFDRSSTTASTTNATTSSSCGIGATSTSTTSSFDKDKKISSHYGSSAPVKSYQTQTTSSAKAISSSSKSPASFTSSTSNNRQRDKMDSYKSYYETNL
uniref:Uncharacterized protein n=1 Tax=Haematobia irritans TaxID=7368 RepID=A0A1L8EIX3_HAEIR